MSEKDESNELPQESVLEQEPNRPQADSEIPQEVSDLPEEDSEIQPNVDLSESELAEYELIEPETTLTETTQTIAPTVAASAGNSFGDFGLDPRLVRAVEAAGYTQPTPIQAKTIPHLIKGRDVLGQAQTGTGKTAAFALPSLHRLDPEIPTVQVLVLTPTRELAIQVADSYTKYASQMRRVPIACIYGGQDYQIQFRQLDSGAQIVVGTPGRIMDHMRRGSLVLDAVQCLVLDEADEMLKMGFADDVEWILNQTPGSHQTALFSATMPEPIRRIASQHLKDPAHVKIAQQSATADTVRQRYVVVTHEDRPAVLARLLEAEPTDGVLVFVRTKMACEPLADYLRERGFRVAALHGEVAQRQRERVIDGLKNHRIQVVVATDVAARGLDVQRISHVINYDPPNDSEVYIHRIGRTGRAGRSGEAILMVSPRERGRLRLIEKETRQTIQPMEVPSNRQINKKRVQQFHDQIDQAREHADVESYKSILEQYQRSHEGIPLEEIAAALAVLAQQGKPLLERDTIPTLEFSRERPGKENVRGDRTADRSRDSRRGPPVAEGMESYRVDVGRRHGATVSKLAETLASSCGISIEDVGRIHIEDDSSTVQMPEGLPPDLLRLLQQQQFQGQPLRMRRCFEGQQPGGRGAPGYRRSFSGPRAGGPRSSGPRSGGPRDAGPRASGPRSGGPRPGGPRSGGPRSARGPGRFDDRPPRRGPRPGSDGPQGPRPPRKPRNG
jgi:ATP-dependent RNA helicase DeaD